MKLKLIPTAHELISNMRSFFQLNNEEQRYLNEEPLRAELFSSDQMERFSKRLAKKHKLSTKPGKDHLLKRLAENEYVLHEVQKLLTDSIKNKYQITPAGEWLIDNFYLIEEHIRIAKINFPKKYSEDLPQLQDGPSLGVTRIYDIVLQIVSHTDGRIDIENLSGFIKAYQTVVYLELGELWAIPIMLRLALIENIRRVSSNLAIDRVDRNLANYWAHEMIDTAEKNPKNLILVIADMARSNPPMVSAFISELTRHLRGKGHELGLTLSWVEQQLSEKGLTSGDLINSENQKQAADQVSMSNSIGSLRLLGGMDWRDFVETHSIVEQILLEDDEGIYGLMDFPTRDRYRHVVEYIANKSNTTEHEVARIAIRLTKENAPLNENDNRTSHVGYYLIDKGVSQTKKLAKMKVRDIQKMVNFFRQHSFFLYLSLITLITLALSTGVLMRAFTETKNTWLLIFIVFLSLLCISQLAISIVNFFSTLLVKPHLLPRMNFSHEIPPRFRTLVVVPAILNSTGEIESLVEALEIRFLANRNKNLHFGLLSDLPDASQETLPDDQSLISLAQEKIEELNNKYDKENNNLFYLFHRPRLWNVRENAWIGYERKRGKLSELNSLLRGGSKERFSLIVGDQSVFPLIKYVITLDADTQLPLGAAGKLIGTIAHPLNQAWYNEKKGRVTKGYGILQPRVTVSLPDITSSFFARMHGNEPGMDPYTRASSDVYQDLFSEGSFIGKGIYDVDMFKKALDGKFADNSILSHDLLEGCYLRSGMISDVQLFETYPTSYQKDMERYSRWVRGDWQIFAWLFPRVPGNESRWYKNPISGLSRWKIFDNIRRSLVPIALTTMLLLDWLIFPSYHFWTGLVSAIIIIPIFITTLWDTIRKPKNVILFQHIKNSVRNAWNIFIITMFTLICLPYEAFVNVKAIMVTIFRMVITRKKLLEWNPFSTLIPDKKTRFFSSYASMWVEPALALILFFYLSNYSPKDLFVAGPILFFWVLAPTITWWMSQPLPQQLSRLTNKQNIFLQKLARKTWSFFERFVDTEDNWLPPDNFQEQPIAHIAHRTSPTNIGLTLLANISASDFGYLTPWQLLERTSKTLITMNKMERYKNHFYNWYDTITLNPLHPKYISTVDSGNLAGHLLIAKQGMLALQHKKIAGVKLFAGLRDTMDVLCDTLTETEMGLLQQFRVDLESCNAEILTSYQIKQRIGILIKNFVAIAEQLNNDPQSESYWWKHTFNEQLLQIDKALQILNPWILLKSAPKGILDDISINDPSTLCELLKTGRELQATINEHQILADTAAYREWFELFQSSLTQSLRLAELQISTAENLALQCDELADMEWDFLYDKSSHLFTIGYNVHEHHLDSSSYDLLASEARLCTYIGIAQGKLPEDSWFALGRILTNMNGNSVLLSWSGSMFEYLMPLLVMPTYENTLLDQTYKSVVRCQIQYGRQTNLPWGISESGFNMISASSHYQYRAFGYPGLGLKRGLEEDSVIAPYASALALLVAPEKACENLELLSEKGLVGRYGFYEAIDYTPTRLPRGQSSAIIYSFMAHHQGMTLLSLAYLLLDKPMQKLFEMEPQFKAILLLLQERIPKATTLFKHTTDIADVNYVASGTETRVINKADTPNPEVQLLSNGRYHVMVTNAGGGYSRWKNLAVTRWREDSTCDNWGTFFYINDLKSETFWSNTHQPVLKKGDAYEAVFSQGRVDFHTTHKEIETHTEIVVSPEDDIEMRRVLISNCSDIPRTIEVTSYAEVVIAPAASDTIQPAFSNLFVQTEIIPLKHAILCTRRPRSAGEQMPWMFHLLSIEGKYIEEISYETDRMKFIGRGNTIVNPTAMQHPGPLSGSQGSVLDPIVAIRYKITIAPDETVTIDMVTGIAETKEACQKLIVKYQHNKPHKDRVFEMAWTHSQVVLRQINASETDAQLYARIAGSILYTNSKFRADPAILINNRRQQSGLWGYSISGDLPIVLLKIGKQTNLQLVKQLVQAHSYWRLKGLQADLVIWNEAQNGYRQVFQNEIESLIPPEFKDRSGGVFVRASDQISNEDRILFQSVAHIIIDDENGALADQVNRKRVIKKPAIPYLLPTQIYSPSLLSIPLPEDLIFNNGLGGFSADGSEYIMAIQNKNRTPVPWVNVIANPDFGTVISESGSSYTWTENAHELRLTPWNNDPVSDISGEAFYLRDEESGRFWSASLFPAGGESPYITRHGFGYSVFEHVEDGIYSEMLVYVDVEAPIKFIVLKIRNQSGRIRKLSATGYTEWVLGDDRVKTAMHIHTEIDPHSEALFAKNLYSTEFSHRVAFFDVDYLKKTFTADRTEFIGRNGTLQNPDAMSRIKLSGKIGLTLDPCAAIQVPFDMADGEEQEIIFRLGAGKDDDEATGIAKKFRGFGAAFESFEKVKKYWKHTADALKVETPDKAINLIANGWLTYQTISSRLWGRSGFYQSGGAFGFRDQLQDVLSLLHIDPQLARKQILLCAAHQFKEGDVQHWWHPPLGRGVRTRISDDFLWLPFVTSLYILHTGDSGILDETAYFLEGRLLNEGEESYYDLHIISIVSASLYDHCILAIKHGFNYGEHGLPLIGTGDWNDGFDKVGHLGKGESVWMAFFLYDILIRFAETAKEHNDVTFAEVCKKEAQQLKANIDKHAWDGEWYKRAWFDDGMPLGSSGDEECKIDSIAQSWSVLSGAGDNKLVQTAMESAYNNLVQKDAGIIKLLEPPFDKSDLNPGYIKGYVPGVRENGGQYTHAAVWMIMAFAKLGNNARVWELLNMINPINHAKTPAEVGIYKVEPYVVAADVYDGTQHQGRGGWTWYTGSAGWLYRLITESFLGLKLEGNKLKIQPCIPKEWESFKAHYRYKNTMYNIEVTQINMGEKFIITVNGVEQKDNVITLEATEQNPQSSLVI